MRENMKKKVAKEGNKKEWTKKEKKWAIKGDKD